MNEELHRAISAGVVLQVQGGYRCEVCNKEVTDILPHLRGKDHFNNLAWEALKSPSPHPFLVDAIPPVVREAKERRELELVDRASFSYRCLVCPKKPLSNGIKPLETHLKGKEHEKAKNSMPLLPNTPSLPSTSVTDSFQGNVSSQALPISQPPPLPSDNLLGATGLDPELQRALNEGVVNRGSGHALTCRVCDKNVTGPASCLEHLRSDKHKGKAQTWRTQPLPDIGRLQLVDELPRSNLESYIDSQPVRVTRKSEPQALPISQPPPLPSDKLPGATGLDPELQRALNEGVVNRGAGHAFTCRVCDKNVTGPASCLEHLRSDKHKKKVQTWSTQPLPGIGRLQEPVDGPSERVYDSQEIGVPVVTREPVDRTFRFPWRVQTGTNYFPASDKVYRNLSMPRGLVLIFNYCFTGVENHERHGAKRDSFNLKTLFHHMGYLVYMYEDFTKSHTIQALSITQDDLFLRKFDSLIVFVLSHGKDDQIFYTASCRDEDCMKLDDLRNRFTDQECPSLRGKPKLFFVNFCRGTNLEPQLAYDSIPFTSSPRDMVTLYSCINTFKSPRDPEKGTLFVQAWCEVLAAYAYSEELRDLNIRVCKRLVDMRGATPELQEYFFKKFYFNPVHTQY